MAANDELLDAAILHQVLLRKYSNNVVRRLMKVLNRADDALFRELISALDRLDPNSFTVERLEAMLQSVRGVNAQAYAQIHTELNEELLAFVAVEVAYQQATLQSVLPVQFSVASVSPDQVFAAALARPFQGIVLKGALADLEATKAKRIRQTIAQGFVENKSNAEIVREIRGARALKYADGLLEIDRRSLQTIVQTAISHIAAFTHRQVHEANADVLKGLLWSAKLDLRTTSACRIRDHKLWTVDHKPIGHKLPWGAGPGAFHWNCRSSAAPMVKSFQELLGMGIDESQFPIGTRASLDGQVPANQTYNEWLTRQSAARQDEVLGPTRGKLLRAGKLSADQMYSTNGDFLDLSQLKVKYGV